MFVRVKYLTALLLGFVAVACADSDMYGTSGGNESPAGNALELLLGIPDTRATLDEDLNLRWQRGDRITFIAYDGADQIFAKEASFWAQLTSDSQAGFPQSYFKAKFNSATEQNILSAIENYTSGKCYAVSPINGVSISGTSATMTLPALQTGEYSSAYDFMTARSGEVNELMLSTGENEDYVNDIDLQFQHHTHAFRVTIPGNNLGKEIVKAYLKFPFNVVGSMTVDYTTGSVSSSPTSDLVTVEFAKPKSAGDEFWVFIAGVENKGSVDIRFQAADGTFTERRVANFSQQNWSSGKISKIRMSVPQATTYTTVKYTVSDYSKLGEPVEKLHLTLPSGYYFADYGQTKEAASAVDASEFEFELFSDMVDNTLKGSTLSVSYESAHAKVPSTIKYTDSSLSAPYLFEEDFSGIQSYERDIETSAQGTACDAYDLSAYGLSSGWTGARTGGEAGTLIRVGGRVDEVFLGTTRTYGRLDSAPLNGIKSGASVKVSVSFRYSGGRTGSSKYSPNAICGYVTNLDKINGFTTTFKESAQWADVDGAQSVPDVPTSGGTWLSMTYSIGDCTASHRLSWQVVGLGRSKSITNGNQWMCIDDIKVSIVQ